MRKVCIILLVVLAALASSGYLYWIKYKKSAPIKTIEDAIDVVTQKPALSEIKIQSNALENKIPPVNPLDKTNPFKYKNPFK